jgi:chromosome segregation ATPase
MNETRDRIFGHVDAASNDAFSQAIKKVALVGSIDELVKQKLDVQVELDKVITEYRYKSDLLATLNSSINSSRLELEHIDDKIQGTMKSKFAEIASYEARLDEAQQTTSSLNTRNLKRSAELTEESNHLEARSKELDEKSKSLQISINDNRERLTISEKDLIKREVKLNDDRVEFEAYKKSIAKDIARLTELGQANQVISQQIEASSKLLDAKTAKLISETSKLDEKIKLVSKHNAENVAKEAELRSWEAKLKHFELEHNSKVAEFSLEMRKNHLNKVINVDKWANA